MQESCTSLLVCPRLKSIFLKKIKVFLKINIFVVNILFWCADVKNIFLKIKINIILIFFQKKYFNKRYYTFKNPQNLYSMEWVYTGLSLVTRGPKRFNVNEI